MGWGRERERNIDWLFHLFMHSLVASYMCPDWGSNWQPCVLGQRPNQLSYPAKASWSAFAHQKPCGRVELGQKYMELSTEPFDFFLLFIHSCFAVLAFFVSRCVYRILIVGKLFFIVFRSWRLIMT